MSDRAYVPLMSRHRLKTTLLAVSPAIPVRSCGQETTLEISGGHCARLQALRAQRAGKAECGVWYRGAIKAALVHATVPAVKAPTTPQVLIQSFIIQLLIPHLPPSHHTSLYNKSYEPRPPCSPSTNWPSSPPATSQPAHSFGTEISTSGSL